MSVIEGNGLKSKLTGKVYRVKRVDDDLVVLGTEDGLTQVWTNKDTLDAVYEKVDQNGLVQSSGNI